MLLYFLGHKMFSLNNYCHLRSTVCLQSKEKLSDTETAAIDLRNFPQKCISRFSVCIEEFFKILLMTFRH